MKLEYKKRLEQLEIDPEDFEIDFSQITVTRGIAYFEENKVLEIISIDEGNDKEILNIKGIIQGSGQQKYHTTVIIEPNFYNIEVSSHCSCPVGHNCKHGVALLFSFIRMLEEQESLAANDGLIKDDDFVNDWLDAIESKEQAPQNDNDVNQLALTSSSSSVQYHVVYLLNTIEPDFPGDDEGFCIQVFKARVLKKGGYGKEYPMSYYSDVNVNAHNVACEKLDEDIVKALKSFGNSSYSYDYGLASKFFISGEIGEIILKKVLQTGRSFWQTQRSRALTQGQGRQLLFNWQDQGANLSLVVNAEPPIQRLFKLERFHYIDIENGQCGLLEHETLSDQQIEYFLSAPPIPKEKAQEASERLLTILPEAELPLPVPIDITSVEIKDVKPVFHLKLHAVPIPMDTQSRLMHVASLSFDYDGVICRPEHQHELEKAVSVILDDKTRYKIHRDNYVEKQALDRLYQQGFQSLEKPPYGVLDMVIYAVQNLSDSIMKWDDFRQNTVPILESEGWQVSVDDSFSLEIEIADDWHAELEESENGDWFEMTLGFELNGKPINMLPLVIDLLANSKSTEALHQSLKEKDYELLQVGDYQWVKIPSQRILMILDTVIELYDTASLNKDGNLEFSKHAGLHYGELLNDPNLKWKGADELKALNNKLRNFDGIEKVATPKGLQAELREYQQEGYNWLQFLRDYQLNGILADDMGLGKTVQALANILKEKEAGRASQPSLVIAPTSLMSNWRRESEKFTPELKVLILQGPDRKEKFDDILDYDLVLTTYPLMVRDTEFYKQQSFHYLILDEAQNIKNAKSKTTQIIYKLKSNHRLCLTGTPIENHLGELWSMFHFLMPGYLGTQERFTRLFRTPIEKNGDGIRGEQLRNRVQPFMLRRTKELVAKDLPEKTEMIRSVPLVGKQRDLYETVRLAMDKKVQDEISKKGLARSHIMILDALLKLRQVCCDPQLVKLAKAKKVKQSAKLELLMEMVPEMVEEGRKILIFSQFTTMLSIIEKALSKRKISHTKLTGQTRKREEAISAFQDGDASVFLISLKAGGVGLNLTAADTVIHYDPWWNPAVERQATDRAYRIGQDKPVFVYKLLTEETVEEKILKLQEKKQQLADGVYDGTGKKDLSFGQSELMDLLKPLE